MTDLERVEHLKLKPVTVSVEDLLLDPNNPRFSKHRSEEIPREKYADPGVQQDTYERMLDPKSGFEIKDLADSIRVKGYAPVDNIFVEAVGGGKYLVIEGNRRLTAIKFLLQRHAEGREADLLPEATINTMQEIPCIDMTDEDREQIDFILGLRHHGSIKQWQFLPSAFNIYKRYMEEYSSAHNTSQEAVDFRYIQNLAKKVAELYSLKPAEVRDKLYAYRAYLQLRELTSDPELDKKFSIIHDATKNSQFRNEFGFDTQEGIYSEEGAEKVVRLISGSDGADPVVKAASAGEDNLRDLIYVLSKGTDEDKLQVVEEGRSPSDVKADVRVKENERNLMNSLEFALVELRKIKIGDDFAGLGAREEEIVQEIEEILNRIKTLADK